ncbi:hypothetical protein GCM10027515_09910 [Schumannella luteola]|uniref:Putative alpha-1,2-mannosidase n=1 Tax=Schumannella luteola TaxID=472059 RepID=A0A852YI33_9MICO|nr:putative alpha-1,2-mannosidase [Schumannella luteola]
MSLQHVLPAPARALAGVVAFAIAAGGALAVGLPATAAQAAPAPTDYASLVDPFVSTAADDGNDLPGAQAPNGLAKVNPMTVPNRNHSGYDYTQSKIAGFTNTNLDGVGGSGGGGDILVVPTSVDYTARPSTGSYAHSFSHSDEEASPGYYRVGLGAIAGKDGAVTTPGGTIQSELTATTRTGLHRYAFPAGSTPSLVVDLANNYTSRTASSLTVTKLADQRAAISGRIAGSFNGAAYQLYYYAETTKPVTAVQTWGAAGAALSSATTQDGVDTGAVLKFATADAADVELRVTLSPISADQARIDQQAEIAGATFDQVRAATRAVWNGRLGSVDVTASTTSDPDGSLTKLFYTHLYRMFALPMNATSTSGTYRGVDGAVHRAEGFTYYDAWSSWDDFRKYSVFAYVAPEMYRDMVQSLIYLFADSASSGTALSSAVHSVPTVRWERSSVIIADAISKGFTGFDRLGEAYPAIDTLVGRYTGAQLRAGYIANDPGNSVQRGYDQWALAIIADALGRTDDAAKLREQAALPIANLIKPGAFTAADGTQAGLLTPRDANGNWTSVDYERFEAASLYQGTLWQYNWYDAYDMDGLIQAMGGTDATRLALEHMFGEDRPDDGKGMLHSNANEIDLQAPYLFNYVGEPSLTQKWVRSIYTKETWNRYIATGSTGEAPSANGEFTPPIKTKVYKLDPAGFLPTMDNDAGTMSTMFVAASIGLFPVTAGSSQFQIGSPFFDTTTINYASGRSFSVSAKGVSADDYYVQSATLNGKPFGNTWLDYADVVGGGSLEFQMGAKASTWGSKTQPAYSLSTAEEGGSQPGTATVAVDANTVQAAANGAVDGTVTMTLSGGRFASAAGTSLTGSGAATVAGLPAGLAAEVTVADATSVRIHVTGTAAEAARFSIAFADSVFADGLTAREVTGPGLSSRDPLIVSVASAERVALQQLIDQAALVRPGNYSAASYRALTSALENARTVVDAATASTADLRAAADRLNGAIAGLALDQGAYRTLQAEASDAWSAGQLKNESFQSGGNLGGVTTGSWVRYDDLDFAGASPQSVAIRYSSSASSTGAPSRVDVRAGDANGPIVATASLPGTNGWGNYTTVTVAITDPAALAAAKQASFTFTAPSGQQWVSNFDWFQFSTDPVGGAPVTTIKLTAPNATATGGGSLALNLANGKFENVTNGAWAQWNDVELGSGVVKVSVEYDKPQSRAASDSAIELRLGSLTGAVAAKIALPYTGSGWGTTGTATADLDPAVFAGTKNVFAVFTSTTQNSNQPYVANVNSFELTPKPASSSVANELEAEKWVTKSTADLKSENSTWNNAGPVTNLGGTANGAWLDYGTLDFGDKAVTAITVRYVNNSSRVGDNTSIDVVLDGYDPAKPGTPAVNIPLPVTGSTWQADGSVTAKLAAPITGKHSVQLVFHTTPAANRPYAGNVDKLVFERGVVTTGLAAAITATEGLAADGARYSVIDFAVFQRELAAAKKLLAAPTTQSAVDAQARSLRLAAGQLVPVSSIRLDDAIAQAAAIDADRYTADSAAALATALVAAKRVAADTAASDADRDAATAALTVALAGLAVKPAAAPAAPVAASAVVADSSVTVRWAAVVDAITPVTSYLVELDDSHQVTVEASQTSVVFTWLKAGETVRARVTAINAAGASTPTEWATPVVIGAPAPAANQPRVAAAGASAADGSAASASPFAASALAAGYSSDAWPATANGKDYLVNLLSGVSTLGTDVLGTNKALPNSAAVTAANDQTAIRINNSASTAQVKKAEIDADNSPTVTMADGFGSRLGSLYLTALNGGKLPKTSALFGRVTQGLDSTGTAKDTYNYLRPYVRLGFVGDGGRIYESSNGSYAGLAGNGSFPSGHTYSGYVTGTLLATLLPELAPQVLARASEYGDNRIVLGFHYPIDVMGGRMAAQATIAHRWADPEFAALMTEAHQELESVLGAACTDGGFGDDLNACAGALYNGLDATAATKLYTERLSYGLPQDGAAGQKITVPDDAVALLASSFPELDDAQRRQILEQTALDSGYPLDVTAQGDASWQRIDLARAMTAEYTLDAAGNVTVGNGVSDTDASIAAASDLKVAGVTLDGFDPSIRTYVVDWPTGHALPAVSASASVDGASVSVTSGAAPVERSAAGSAGSSARTLFAAATTQALLQAPLAAATHARTVTVTSANGQHTQQYTVLFTITADDHLPAAVDPGAGDPGDGGPGTGEPGTGTPGTGTPGTPGSGSGGTGAGAVQPAAGGRGSAAGDDLAATGVSGLPEALAAALLLLAAGAGLVVARRRRAARAGA